MIKINKSRPAPVELTSQAAPANENEVDRCIYNYPAVKGRLMRDQRKKCCYCETYLSKYADIEHYRPKKAFVDRHGNMYRPGYYWLTLDWDNLLLSCKTCNSSHKKNHFGLVNENSRDIAGKSIVDELPLLINPLTEDPGRHIKFRRHCAVESACEGCAERGRYTIRILQLNRRSLRWRRLEVWNKYQVVCDTLRMAEIILHRNPADPEALAIRRNCNAQICRCKSVSTQYSGMINHQVTW